MSPDSSTPTTDPPPEESISSLFSVVFESLSSRDSKTTRKKTTRSRLSGRGVAGGGRRVGGNGLSLESNITTLVIKIKDRKFSEHNIFALIGESSRGNTTRGNRTEGL